MPTRPQPGNIGASRLSAAAIWVALLAPLWIAGLVIGVDNIQPDYYGPIIVTCPPAVLGLASVVLSHRARVHGERFSAAAMVVCYLIAVAALALVGWALVGMSSDSYGR